MTPELANARLAQLERERFRLDRFAAIAAHELAEPLLLTQKYADLLLDRLGADADPESRSELEALARVTARLRVIVETLLEEARSSDGELRREPVDLSQVVEDGLALLEPEIRARGARVEVQSLPTVRGDASLLGVVMTNLISNAIRHGAPGGNVRVAASGEPHGWRISVLSEGTPIAPEDRRRLFEPFERGARARATRGSGLGLAICRTIVERHGGVLDVSASGHGNRFHFTLPA